MLFTVSGHGQDTLISGSRAGASPHVPLLPVLVHRKILGVSWSDAANPHGLCRALQVRNTEPSAARVVRAFLGWWEGCPAPCWSHPNWYSLILGSLGGSWWVPLLLQPVSTSIPAQCASSRAAAWVGRGSCKASKNAREQPRIIFSGSLLGHVGRRAQSRSVIRKCSTVRWCLPVGWRREEEGYHGQGQCQDIMYWCCWHQFILGFGQII